MKKISIEQAVEEGTFTIKTFDDHALDIEASNPDVGEALEAMVDGNVKFSKQYLDDCVMHLFEGTDGDSDELDIIYEIDGNEINYIPEEYGFTKLEECDGLSLRMGYYELGDGSVPVVYIMGQIIGIVYWRNC